MSKPLVIFGAGEIAEVAQFYFRHDSDWRVAAFTVDASYIKEESFGGLPVVPFEEITAEFPPAEYDLFVATGYGKVNRVRAGKFAEAKVKGYRLPSYINSRATIWPGLVVGENCFILEDNTIQPFVRIGNNVTLWSGNHIGHHVTIRDHCFIASQVVISGGVEIGERCFIGVNATCRDHIAIAPGCVIGAGGLILKDTVENGVYIGPAAELQKVPSDRLKKI